MWEGKSYPAALILGGIKGEGGLGTGEGGLGKGEGGLGARLWKRLVA